MKASDMEENQAQRRSEQLRLLEIQGFFQSIEGSSLVILVSGILLSFLLMAESIPVESLMNWLLLLSTLSALTYFFERYVKGLTPEIHSFKRLLFIRYVLGGLLTAAFSNCLVFIPIKISHIAFAFISMVAMAISASSYLAYTTAYLYAFIISFFLLFPLFWMSIQNYIERHDNFYLLMAGFLAFWKISFAARAYFVSRVVRDHLEVRTRLQDEARDHGRVVASLRNKEADAQALMIRFRRLCDSVPDMIWTKDLAGRYTFVNQSFSQMFMQGRESTALLGRTWEEYAADDQERRGESDTESAFWHDAKSIENALLESEAPLVYEESGYVDGKLLYLDIYRARLLGDEGEILGSFGCARDVTSRKLSESYMQHQAQHDILTDLPNRLLFGDRLRQAIAQAKRDNGRLAILFIDLDRLKPVNDNLGHDIGDLLLKAVAERLKDVVSRRTDTISRFGGDEFVILLSRIHELSEAQRIADRLLETLRQPFSIGEHKIDISASIGISLFPDHGREAEELLRNADTAMYVVKRGGRDACHVFTHQDDVLSSCD